MLPLDAARTLPPATTSCSTRKSLCITAQRQCSKNCHGRSPVPQGNLETCGLGNHVLSQDGSGIQPPESCTMGKASGGPGQLWTKTAFRGEDSCRLFGHFRVLVEWSKKKHIHVLGFVFILLGFSL
uniref:Uncharacterized protein n=1 Tax=Myotis myotis TaxID=51298 RepID=A0A7J7VZ40_MYOMY|nr:hypothetical protein mMyoMyo1_012259 [Myotis myotis]